MKKYLFTFPMLLFMSCASFKPSLTNNLKKNLTKAIIKDFNHKYEVVSYGHYLKKNEHTSSEEELFHILTDSIRPTNNKIKQYVVVSFPNKSKVSFKFFSDTTLLLEQIIAGKLKSNGFFHLSNKKVECHGIPYILGGCNKSKLRLGTTKSGELIIENAISNEGALLLVIGSGYSYSVAYIYRELE